MVLTPAVLGLVWAFTGGANLYVYQSAPLVRLFLWLLYREGSFQIGFYFDYPGGFLLAVVMSFYWPLIGLSWIK
jgi:hypothetical protein